MCVESYPQQVLKFCPRCGKGHFVPYNDKANKCDTCGFIFYFNAATAVAVILKDAENRVLLTTRAFNPGKGTLDLPGGFVDPLESAEHAIDREIKEELNLTITEKKYLGSFPNTYLYGDVVYFTCDLVFECKVETFDGLQAKDDVTHCDFFTVTEELLENVGATSIKNILRHYFL